MPESAERRRERARVAQRRSRAQRKATMEGLQSRVQTLTRALEGMTEQCLGFSDVVISAVREDNFEFLQESAKPFMRKVLNIASNVLDEEEFDDGGDNALEITPLPGLHENYASLRDEEAPEDTRAARASRDPTDLDAVEQSLQAITTSYSPRHETVAELAIQRPVSPCLAYGLWPSDVTICMEEDMPPLDVMKYMDINGTNISFSIALFWNTISFAQSVLIDPSSALAKKLFGYAGRFEPMDLILSRIHRRLSYKPSQMIPYMDAEIQARQEQVTIDVSSVLKDPYQVGGTLFEASKMDEHNRKIIENMNSDNDHIEQYIDAAGVQERLCSYWGISSAASLDPPQSQPKEPPTNEKQHQSTHSSKWYQNLIRQLALNSRCVGNGIGFPIQVVDDLALQMRATSIVG